MMRNCLSCPIVEGSENVSIEVCRDWVAWEVKGSRGHVELAMGTDIAVVVVCRWG